MVCTKCDIATTDNMASIREAVEKLKRGPPCVEVSSHMGVNVDLCFLLLAHLIDSHKPRSRNVSFDEAKQVVDQRVKKNEYAFSDLLDSQLTDFNMALEQAVEKVVSKVSSSPFLLAVAFVPCSVSFSCFSLPLPLSLSFPPTTPSLSVFLCCLFLSLCICLCLSVSVSLSLLSLSLSPSLSLSLSLSVFCSVSVSLSVSLFVSLCLSVCVSPSVSLSLSFCLCLSLFIYSSFAAGGVAGCSTA